MRLIYVDESRITKGCRFQLFGSLWVPRDYQDSFREAFWNLWDEQFPSRRSELKWTKVSRSKLDTYKKFVDLFAKSPKVSFRCVILDTHAIDYQTYHEGDEELGFYKFIYFFLSRNIEKDYEYGDIRDPYQAVLDRRRKEDEAEVGRLTDLKSVLNNRLRTSCAYIEQPVVRNVEADDSKKAPEIQMADLLMGAVGYSWEGFDTSPHKVELRQYMESTFGHQLDQRTPFLSEKINIWYFRLQQ